MTPEHDHHHWNLTWMGSDQLLARSASRSRSRGSCASKPPAGMLMLLGTVAALGVVQHRRALVRVVLAHRRSLIDVGGFHLDLTLQEWVNDGLMALFFFVAGMEIKREMVSGELRDPKAAALPIIAALGGMIVPALIYTAFNHGGPGSNGWGIPMATDIAFAVGRRIACSVRACPCN